MSFSNVSFSDMTPDELFLQAASSYTEQYAAMQNYHDAKVKHIEATTQLKIEIARAIVDEKIQQAPDHGRNKEQRDAHQREYLDTYYAMVDLAEDNLRQARHRSTLADIAVDRVKMLVRIVEWANRLPQVGMVNPDTAVEE